MKTVLYFEWTRKRQNILKHIVWSVGTVLALFLLCALVDKLAPAFNRDYMKWPDVMKDLFCIGSWNSHLWLNLWQFFALVYPFCLVYMVMTGFADAVTEEERLETIVYLHNAGVDKKAVLLGKAVWWGGGALACCGALLVVNVILALILGAKAVAFHALLHYIGLWLLCLLYMSIAAFMAACKGKERVSSDSVMTLLLLPLLISRIPALLRFFSVLMEMTGREGAVADGLADWGKKLEMLSVVSPVTWCWPALSMPIGYMIVGVLVFGVMCVAGVSIYTHR